MRDEHIRKYYDKETKLFYVIIKGFFTHEVHKFKRFTSFVKYLNGDLSFTDLYDFDFEGVNLKKFNIEKVGINREVLKKNG